MAPRARALANRLSAAPGNRVLVLEAGRPDYLFDVFVHMPAALTFPIGSRYYDWKYESEPEPFMNGRRIYHARGKILGGSSSINGMIFQRGNPLDYERWAADPGMDTWDYAHCLPYFRRMESCLAAGLDDPFRGHAGPLVLERGPASSPLFGAFFEAVQQAGYQLTDDVNGYRQEGFAPFDRNIRNGRRLSASRAYLHPVMDRPNLEVRTRAFVTRILFEGKRAIGVEYTTGKGAVHRAYGGTVDPRGRVDQLAAAAPAVGRRQRGRAPGAGHRSGRATSPAWASTSRTTSRSTSSTGAGCRCRCSRALQNWRRPWIGVPVAVPAHGPGRHQPLRGRRLCAQQRGRRVPQPDVPLPAAGHPLRRLQAPSGGHGYQVHIGPMYSDARGSVKITSTDPTVHPALRFNYLSTDQDRREWVEAIHVARGILGQPAFEPFNAGELSPGPSVATDQEILDWVARDGETALHPSCTARMGIDDQSVLDPLTMGVHGVEGLKVVDASAMPYVTNGNIYAPVMMLAEKAADLVLGNTPLAPEPVEYYRHRPA